MSVPIEASEPRAGSFVRTQVKSGTLALRVELDDGTTASYDVEFGTGTEITMTFEPVLDIGPWGTPEPTGRHNFTVNLLNATDFHGEIKRE